ncbi:MAG: hypothetical protein NVSMB42_26820 [Herpetosiphon sp.]
MLILLLNVREPTTLIVLGAMAGLFLTIIALIGCAFVLRRIHEVDRASSRQSDQSSPEVPVTDQAVRAQE